MFYIHLDEDLRLKDQVIVDNIGEKLDKTLIQ
jgi:ATP/ADP translocase